MYHQCIPNLKIPKSYMYGGDKLDIGHYGGKMLFPDWNTV